METGKVKRFKQKSIKFQVNFKHIRNLSGTLNSAHNEFNASTPSARPCLSVEYQFLRRAGCCEVLLPENNLIFPRIFLQPIFLERCLISFSLIFGNINASLKFYDPKFNLHNLILVNLLILAFDEIILREYSIIPSAMILKSQQRIRS